MIQHIFRNGDLAVVIRCDLCGHKIRDIGYAECVFADGKDGDAVKVILGHQRCTREREAKVGVEEYPNNINLQEYIERIGKII